MLHKMKLNESPFERIKNGKKTIEFRLYDEKRQQIKIGDKIEFSKLPEDFLIFMISFDFFSSRVLPILELKKSLIPFALNHSNKIIKFSLIFSIILLIFIYLYNRIKTSLIIHNTL